MNFFLAKMYWLVEKNPIKLVFLGQRLLLTNKKRLFQHLQQLLHQDTTKAIDTIIHTQIDLSWTTSSNCHVIHFRCSDILPEECGVRQV